MSKIRIDTVALEQIELDELLHVNGGQTLPLLGEFLKLPSSKVPLLTINPDVRFDSSKIEGSLRNLLKFNVLPTGILDLTSGLG